MVGRVGKMNVTHILLFSNLFAAFPTLVCNHPVVRIYLCTYYINVFRDHSSGNYLYCVSVEVEKHKNHKSQTTVYMYVCSYEKNMLILLPFTT